ncbi:hypothetical protein FY036_20935 [Mesorhizobium microcysteis]|uniref:Uncharacterized protein n=1 Tax=Neoaquamicrobium microcysteis TaxID=2682781 RepID=A0A5D4GLV4_9HYPH|nr:hypothetical protein [Mesorhizobium microcysteis]TYR29347.1 hypothetical protein FY036_20935 [Mesorhizobium microcysteis]
MADFNTGNLAPAMAETFEEGAARLQFLNVLEHAFERFHANPADCRDYTREATDMLELSELWVAKYHPEGRSDFGDPADCLRESV